MIYEKPGAAYILMNDISSPKSTLFLGKDIVEKTHPMGHNDHLYERAHSAFFDYTGDSLKGSKI